MKIKNRRVFAATAVAMVLGLAMSLRVTAQGGEATTQIDVAAQPLAQAIQAIARQTSMNILVDPKLVEGRDAPAVKAQLSVNQALNLLLQGTGLTPRFVDDKTITLVAVNAPVKTSDSSQVANLRLAQEDQAKAEMQKVENSEEGAAQTENGENKDLSSAEDKSGETTEEIVVTGTNIRGQAPVGSQLVVVDREEIEKAGFDTAADVVRSLTQNFNNGGLDAGSTFSGPANSGTSNSFGSTRLNLRGLGSAATLVLLDGHRLAPGGNFGVFADVSVLPLAAIERVEVLPDGASALYGSDAVGGVVNYILRKDYEGMETRLSAGTSTEGGAESYSLAQTFGTRWDGGHLLLSYEYQRQEELLLVDRDFSDSLDQRPRGGSDSRINLSGNPGTIVAGGIPYALPAGQDGTALTPEDLVPNTFNLFDAVLGQYHRPLEDNHRAFAAMTQEVSPSISLHGRLLYSHRDTEIQPKYLILSALPIPSTNAFYINPTGGTGTILAYRAVLDDYPASVISTEMINAVAGTTADFGAGWQVRIDAGYGRQNSRSSRALFNPSALSAAAASSDPARAINLFGDGPIASPGLFATLLDEAIANVRSTIKDVGGVVDGTLWSHDGGDIRLALGGQYREQDIRSTNVRRSGSQLSAPYQYARKIESAFAELAVPIFGSGNAALGFQALTLSGAVRFEHYSDAGNSWVPKFGINWKPLRSLTLRGSWSKSFRAPDLNLLDPSGGAAAFITLANPQSPTGSSNIIQNVGGNADLKPETARTWTAGFSFSPDIPTGLWLSANYYNIKYSDRLGLPIAGIFLPTLIQNQAQFSEFVIANPTTAQIAEVCARAVFIRPPNCETLPVDFIVDGRTQNSARLTTDGFDISAGVKLKRGTDIFAITGNATFIRNYKFQLRAGAAETDFLNQLGQPVDFRFRGSAGWSRYGWTLTAYGNYLDNYRDDLFDPTAPRPIGSYTTFDLSLGYEVPDGGGPLGNSSINFNIQNLLDQDPPFADTPQGYDGNNADPWGRMVRLTITKRW